MKTLQISPVTLIALYRLGAISPAAVMYLVPLPEILRHCPEVINPAIALEMCRLMKLIEFGGEKNASIP